MLNLILSIIVNGVTGLIIVFLLALALTSMLNPTASIREIFNHWVKTHKGG